MNYKGTIRTKLIRILTFGLLKTVYSTGRLGLYEYSPFKV